MERAQTNFRCDHRVTANRFQNIFARNYNNFRPEIVTTTNLSVLPTVGNLFFEIVLSGTVSTKLEARTAASKPLGTYPHFPIPTISRPSPSAIPFLLALVRPHATLHSFRCMWRAREACDLASGGSGWSGVLVGPRGVRRGLRSRALKASGQVAAGFAARPTA